MSAARSISRTVGLAALLGVVAAGCDPPPPPVGHDLSGRVTFEGQDVETGEIFFTPDQPTPNAGPKFAFPIKDGRYTTAYTRHSAPVGRAHVWMNFVVDEQLYSYETETDLPSSPGTKDFKITKADAKKVPKLPNPGGGGGGGAAAGDGKGKGKGKGNGRDRDKDKAQDSDAKKSTPDKKKAEDKKADDKPADSQPKTDKKADSKDS